MNIFLIHEHLLFAKKINFWTFFKTFFLNRRTFLESTNIVLKIGVTIFEIHKHFFDLSKEPMHCNGKKYHDLQWPWPHLLHHWDTLLLSFSWNREQFLKIMNTFLNTWIYLQSWTFLQIFEHFPKPWNFLNSWTFYTICKQFLKKYAHF